MENTNPFVYGGGVYLKRPGFWILLFEPEILPDRIESVVEPISENLTTPFLSMILP